MLRADSNGRGGLFLKGRITNDSGYYSRQALVLSNVKAEKAQFERKPDFFGSLKTNCVPICRYCGMTLKYAAF
jgi:hypothetical protein